MAIGNALSRQPTLSHRLKCKKKLSSGELNPGLPRSANCLTSGNTDHYTTEDVDKSNLNYNDHIYIHNIRTGEVVRNLRVVLKNST